MHHNRLWQEKRPHEKYLSEVSADSKAEICLVFYSQPQYLRSLIFSRKLFYGVDILTLYKTLSFFIFF